jgi:hypothetical protein
MQASRSIPVVAPFKYRARGIHLRFRRSHASHKRAEMPALRLLSMIKAEQQMLQLHLFGFQFLPQCSI